MSAGQRRLLDKVADSVFDAIAELQPRIIEPSKEKQKALAIADATLLYQVGAFRALAVFPLDREKWHIKEFDSETGELALLRESTSAVPAAEVPVWVLRATVATISDQLATYKASGYPSPAHEASAQVLGRQLAVFEQRLVSRTRQAAVVGASGSNAAAAAVDDDEFDYFG